VSAAQARCLEEARKIGGGAIGFKIGNGGGAIGECAADDLFDFALVEVYAGAKHGLFSKIPERWDYFSRNPY
jgi:hypothetical protein